MTNPILRYALDGPDDNDLACPNCGWAYTHIDKVRAGVRTEDAPITFVELDIVEGQFGFKPRRYEGTETPSGRRQWLEIVIDCEQCAGGTLVLAQHKGVTQTRYIPATTSTD
ncbi:hypothetical protein [Nocardia lijiangensis]|uniref:hypothetical protein n=1 Tax=Nocardia lijiangensis TaxID=299618 RepID=UPI00082C3667|nr:hypothetical protein [Nocardia lijiangensis]